MAAHRKYALEFLVAFKKLCDEGTSHAPKQRIAIGTVIVAKAGVDVGDLYGTASSPLCGEIAAAFQEMIERKWIEEETSLDDKFKEHAYFDYREQIKKIHRTYYSVFEEQKKILQRYPWPFGDNWFKLTSEGENTAKELTNSSKIESYFSQGEEYKAKKKIIEIMKLAKKSLDIQDNYLKDGIFDYLEDIDSKVSIRLLCMKPGGSFKQLYFAFRKERPNMEARLNDNCHGRFIIVDKVKSWHLGFSIEDAGKKADMINEVETENDKQKILSDFEQWWIKGSEITRTTVMTKEEKKE